MKSRKSFPLVLTIVLTGILLAVFSTPAPAQEKSENVVKVYYFHGKVRCATCNKIENLIADAMDNKFKKQIADGKVKFEIIDFSDKKNSHYEKKYDLYSQTLIISQVKNGKESKWKNSEKIWTLHGNKNKFIDYVASEVNDYLKGL
ncbi:MAG: thioredoxin [Candidatus Kapabacteria bacterium]|nr:thioredoxin [Ignavibacteriota bacterium]MCW5885905.1 thioredoxin [Candidatus Kapabacteria bacterium]